MIRASATFKVERFLLGAALVLLCFSVNTVLLAQDLSVPTAEHDPAIAVEWMDLTYRIVQGEAVNAPAASRVYAYAGVTLYEAVVNGMPENYSMAGRATDLPDLSLPEEGAVYDWPSVANASLAMVLEGIFANASDESQQMIADLREKWVDAREEEVEQDVVERSLEYGEVLGPKLLDWIASDGYADTRTMEYELPTGDPAFYVLTTEGTSAVEPFWGTLRPFGLFYPEVCNIPLNMPFETDENSAFYAQANEVKEVGENLTNEQEEIARFWVDTPGQTGTPAGHWVSIENQLVEQLDLNLGRAAEMYGLVGMSLADAFISSWALKYQVLLLRPETYIREYIRRTWQPYIQTPPFPEYPSVHSVVSGAAAEVLTTMFGVVAFTDRIHITYEHEPLQRSFTSFQAAAYQAAISRLYGGIHYRVAIENGLRQGQCVARQVLDNVKLRPIPQGGEG
jgi:hypothetical protein